MAEQPVINPPVKNQPKNPRQITYLRLVQAAMLGSAAEMFQHLSQNESINHKSCKILFDSDPRFIRVESQPARTEKEICVDLIPLTNVASIKID